MKQIRNPAHYFPVVCEWDRTMSLFLLNSHYKAQLEENWKWIEKKRTIPVCDKANFDASFDTPTTDLAIEPTLDLCVRTSPSSASFFYEEEEYASYLEQKMMLSTERLFSFIPSRQAASTRHVMLRDFSLKGVGRFHQLKAVYSNSWGGMKVLEALDEFIATRYLQEFTPLGALPIVALWIEKDKSLQASRRAVVARENALRLSSVQTSLTPEIIEEIAISLTQNFQISLEDKFLEIINHLAFCFAHNIFHLSPIPANLTLDGRFIDCSGIKFQKNPRKWALGVWLTFYENRTCTIDWTAWSNYRDIIRETFSSYNHTFPEFKLTEGEAYKTFEDRVKLHFQNRGVSYEEVNKIFQTARSIEDIVVSKTAFSIDDKNGPLGDMTLLKKSDFTNHVPTEGPGVHFLNLVDIPIKDESASQPLIPDFLARRIYALWGSSSGGSTENAIERYIELDHLIKRQVLYL